MKTLGLIGGTSWHSTIEYYKYINQEVNDFFGDNTNPPLLLYTLNQSAIHKYQTENNWEAIAELILKAANSLIAAGAEQLMLCANTPHKVYPIVLQEINIPILHIADATAEAINNMNINKVCFLGTKYTMTEPFVSNRIADHNIDVLLPETEKQINELHRIIQQELTYGKIIEKSKTYVLDVIQSLVELGAEGVVLGCTEFPLMINASDLKIPIFNTTLIHAKAGTNFILRNYKK
ncbi:aspartate/glutamate racemase family protein [Winogradskyella immobilis]|uniref:Amino acid racemase n=1 Tax=Winogradskyella immobilis TaxID=2816852 RepID=A0ABS8ERD1_9FLAO|nr:amino acid racemase [Winogradskyella immobilis]MCC1485090.1 amino acid racemase [Winogradskyella immobilis]MCG0017182.1 amino acid racemase [Winogradskyella immobilis]